MKVKYMINKPDGEVIEHDQFDSANPVQVYDFLKCAERAIADGHVVTAVKGEDQ